MNNSTVAHREEDLQLPFALKALLYVVVFVVAVLSFIVNTLEIKIFLRAQNLRTSTNYYITSMAFSDLIFVLSSLVVYSMSGLSVFDDVFTSFVCKISTYFWYLSFSVSVLSLVLISLDRFIATVFPMKISSVTGKIRTFFILLTCVWPMAVLIPAFLGVGLPNEADSPRICLWKGSNLLISMYNIAAFTFSYLGPLIVIAILNFWIVKSLRTPNSVIQGNSQVSKIRHKRNRRITKMLILIIVFFFLCYTPEFTFIATWTFINDAQMYIGVEYFYIIAFFILPLLNTFFQSYYHTFVQYKLPTSAEKLSTGCMLQVAAKF